MYVISSIPILDDLKHFKIKEGWFNVYEDSTGRYQIGFLHESRESAEESACRALHPLVIRLHVKLKD